MQLQTKDRKLKTHQIKGYCCDELYEALCRGYLDGITIGSNEKLRIFLKTNWNTDNATTHRYIKYCPFCGNKLENINE